MARLAVRAGDGGLPDEATARAVHGATSDLGVCSTSHEVAELGLLGGRVLVHFDEGAGFWAFAESESPGPLSDDQLDLLTKRTRADWTDGETGCFFEYLPERLGLPAHVRWVEPLIVTQFPGQGRRFAPWSELARTCWQGKLEAARAALAAGEDPNGCPDGLPILHGAIVGGHAEVARLLIERGADVRGRDVLDVQRDPLWTCVTCRQSPGPTALIARMLLERGANPDGGYRGPPLDVARRRGWDDMVRLLEEFTTPPRDGLPLRAGARVRIRTGPFSGMRGWVEQDVSGDAAEPVRVRIELLGRPVVVDVPAGDLHPPRPADESPGG
jgi:hypothetical protein